MKNKDFESQTFSKTLDISKIYSGEKKEMPFSFEMGNDEIGDDEIKLLSPVKVTGRAYEKAAGRNDTECYIGLEIRLEGQYEAECARCAKELTKTFDINKEYAVLKQVQDDSLDYVEAKGGVIDLYNTARTLFFLELDTRVLCKEDCKGLCYMCGTDLNFGTCSCKPERVKNTLSGLEKLLDNFKD